MALRGWPQLWARCGWWACSSAGIPSLDGGIASRRDRAGIAQIAVTTIAGHFCIDAFRAVSPVPVIDMLEVTQLEVTRRSLERVGLLGTRVVMELRFYGVLDGVEVIAPVNDLMQVHEAYVAMASAGVATPAQREVFMRAGMALTRNAGCESILLAGTDLALAFGKGVESGFDILDCAEARALAIAKAAMTTPDASTSPAHASPSAFSRR